MSKRILMGKIAAAHGIKGMVKLQVFAENAQLLNSNPLYTQPQDGRPIAVTLKSPAGTHWLAAVDGVTDRNAAEALRGTELWLDRDRLPEPEPGEYYYADLIGMKVEDEKGQPVGYVIAVVNFGASDLLEIKPDTGDSFYLAFTKETILEIGNGLIRAVIAE